MQQVQDGNPDLLPCKTLQLLLRDSNVFPIQDIVPPASSGSVLVFPLIGTCLENLQRKVIPEPP